MLAVGVETPSRYELLSMIKKHSNLLGKATVEEQDAQDVQMDSQFWHDVFDLYFIRGKESRGREDDDLLFFVKKLSRNVGRNVDGNSPYIVRRWAPKLDELLGENSGEVDWKRSFYLNMIAHTSFSVTVAICSHQDLQNYQADKNTPLSPIYKLVKTVYASPSRVNFHLNSTTKEVETTPAYPELCFAVDDFDSTFDAVVLTERDHCYCVLLNAHDGAAFPNEMGTTGDTSENLNSASESDQKKNVKVTVFSGFVSYQMVREAYDGGKSRFGNFLGHSVDKADRLYMKGPGGRGEVEVAVFGVADQSQIDAGSFSPLTSKRGLSVGSIFRKAASVASVAAKHAYAAAAAASSSEDDMFPLKCCLMSISLPWDHIAHDLLFKATVPVNM